MTSNETNEPLSERDEIEALLPWYVAGRLDGAEHLRVERYLAAHPDVMAHAELAREERDASITGNETILPAGRASLDRLRASVAAQPKSPAAGIALQRLFDRLAERLSHLSPAKLAMGAVAAALVIAVQALTLGSLVGSRTVGPTSYKTATGPSAPAAATDGTFALVTFAPGAPAATLTSFLVESGVQIIDGPKVGGVYRVRLAQKNVSDEAAKALLEKLKTRSDLVAFAALTR